VVFLQLSVNDSDIVAQCRLVLGVLAKVSVLFHQPDAGKSRDRSALPHMERTMYAAIGINYYDELLVQEHRDIIKAICEHDPEAARKRMYDHVVQSKHNALRLTTPSNSRRQTADAPSCA
jgi:FCD domain